MDSLTRFAMAQREIGMSVGEPPVSRGYTPSVFNVLPRLLERSGSAEKGTITALYTVLVEGDDMNEPVADTVRGILDGHIVLSRSLAHRNHFPAIDILASISRSMNAIVPESHRQAAGFIRTQMSVYKEAADMINIGEHTKRVPIRKSMPPCCCGLRSTSCCNKTFRNLFPYLTPSGK